MGPEQEGEGEETAGDDGAGGTQPGFPWIEHPQDQQAGDRKEKDRRHRPDEEGHARRAAPPPAAGDATSRSARPRGATGTRPRTSRLATCDMKLAAWRNANGRLAKRKAPARAVPELVQLRAQTKHDRRRRSPNRRGFTSHGAPSQPAGGQQKREARRVLPAPAIRRQDDVVHRERLGHRRRSEEEPARGEDAPLKRRTTTSSPIRGMPENSPCEPGRPRGARRPPREPGPSSGGGRIGCWPSRSR